MHTPAVLAGNVKLCANWGAPGIGYLLIFRPDPAASAALARLQEQVLAFEPALLRQPEAQLHTSVAWLMAVGRDFDEPKDALWAARGDDWLKIMESITERTEPMRLRYQRLVVTDAAIIAVAEEPTPVGGFRRELTAALGLPWPISYDSVEIVHTTLLRYRQPPSDPAACSGGSRRCRSRSRLKSASCSWCGSRCTTRSSTRCYGDCHWGSRHDRDGPDHLRDKVYFAERGETKADLARHYLRVAEPLLRAIGGRPVLLRALP